MYIQYSWIHCSQVMPWVPQNDILGHPSTKAFLSHMGANGLNEVSLSTCSCRSAHLVRLRCVRMKPSTSNSLLSSLHHGKTVLTGRCRRVL